MQADGRYRFAGDGVKRYADRLRAEMDQRRLRFAPIDWEWYGPTPLRLGSPRRRRQLPPDPTIQRRKTESRRPSSLATDPIERSLEAIRSTACRLQLSVNNRR